MSDNLAIWTALEKTDPRHVKPITGKSYSGNSPKPHYIIWKLTEQFGPVGKGFGWEVIAERYVDGIPHDNGTEKLHECRVRFWWIIQGEDGAVSKSGTVESYGCTKALYKAKQGYWVSDEDAAKKSLTDAIVKAASWLGAAGDIFMGRWDDSKYVTELRDEFRQSRAAIAHVAAGGDGDGVADAKPRTAPERPAETPHDPETGEIPPEHAGALPMTSDTPQAWIDGIKDKLGKNATKRQLAAEYAAMLIAKAEKFKPGPRAMEWVIQFEHTHSAYIDKLPADLQRLVMDALAAARDRKENPNHNPADFRDIGLSEDPASFIKAG